MTFVHLHTHTKYSIMDGHSSIENLFNRAEELGMPGLAITDHGNMYGVKEFFNFAQKHPTIKPIIGCEIYLSCHYDHKLKDKEQEEYYHLILLAKNYSREDLIAMNALYHPRFLHGKFIEDSTKNGHPEAILDKIWRDWQNNAENATIKSHSACYAWISYQTAYLKAHYPAEFEAAKLSNDHDK